MSRIEMEMWEPVEDMKGKVRYAGQRRAVDVFNDLKAILEAEGLLPPEYLLMNSHLKKEALPAVYDLMCYTRWGSNEGIYLDIDIMTHDEEARERRIVHFVTGKSLEESTEEFDRMQFIAGYIYRLFMGDGQCHSRYAILPKEKRHIHRELIDCVDQEFEAYLKSVLYRRSEQEKENRREAAYKEIAVRTAIAEGISEICFPEYVTELLFAKENILEAMTAFCKEKDFENRQDVRDILNSAEFFIWLQEPDEKEITGEAFNEDKTVTKTTDIYISLEAAEQCKDILNLKGLEIYEKYGLVEGQTITFTGAFDDGVAVEINVVICDETSYPYAECALLKEGREFCTPAVSEDSVLGEWVFFCENIEYVVLVHIEQDSDSK